jgi:hypothetical protein
VADDEKEKKAGSSVNKIVATIFGAVIAPILVGVGIRYFDPTKPPAAWWGRST